ncbi:MAG: DUF3256 family protein [Firmicutes bacterium]|nr:DUF3256 family protein [Bacillota bacterium]MCM1400993.1 DUF3256 family protein [Bacteroides sp.]MCM1476518.1 DUF3256 family protein [Bacteroides sp.]
MNTIRKLMATALLTALAALGASAQKTATEAFSTAPRKVMPMLDESTRLDMIDYYNANMDTPSENAYGGKSRITSMSPEQLTVQMTDATRVQIIVLPDGKQGLIGVITTVASPTPDSRLSVYSGDWSRDLTASTFTKPVLTDWLTDAGRKNMSEVELTVPFLLISYTYDPQTKTLTLTNNAREFLGDDVYADISSYLLGKINYRFNGKRFEKVK